MTAKQLIDIARQRLGDTQNQRWTQPRMLDIVNHGQANLCKLSGIYRKEAYIALANDINRYVLPKDLLHIRRLEYNGEILPLYTRNDIDNGKPITTKFVAIKDNLGVGRIDIYPNIEDLSNSVVTLEGAQADDSFYLDTPFGVVFNIDDPYSITTPYGVVTGISEVGYDGTEPTTVFGEVCDSPVSMPLTSDVYPPYGVVTQIEYAHDTSGERYGFVTASTYKPYKIAGTYGLIGTIIPSDSILRVYYEAVPTNIAKDSDTLVVTDIWEEAMVRYIVGTALQDDNDAANIQRGELELQKFKEEALKAREVTSKDFSAGTKEKLATKYRRV